MASEKQLQANKQNAKRSTGPRTKEGKAHSRLNSWKHGLTANMIVIAGEAPDDFEELRTKLIRELEPWSILEAELVERIAGILWRLRRAPFFEAAIIDARQAQLDEEARRMDYRAAYRTPEQFEDSEGDMPDEDFSIYVGSALIRDALGDGLGKLARHEAALMNAFTKTMKELRLVQENRGNTGDGAIMLDEATPLLN